MIPVTENEIRASFVNCSKGDAKRLSVPRDLDERPWEDMDFLGWSDPSLAGRCYVVVPQGLDLVGIALRAAKGGSGRTGMCAICMTTHTGGGVTLMTAAKAGEAGRRGNSVGILMCADLACSLYARNKKRPALGNRYRESLSTEEKVQRVRDNIDAFLTGVQG
ncbi:FBP domain-containing protein [Rhodococcus olei]|uniref:FBP domain-containing protein n=1 Tax=Rhodococcus olei TaxID=2161675 RepID=A0ABP8NX94_9NOCA